MLPGEIIGPAQDGLLLGRGVYVHQGQIRASLVGQAITRSHGDQSLLEIHSSQSSRQDVALVPQAGQWVIGTVSRLNTRQATVDIKLVMLADGSPVYLGAQAFRGTIRQQDILSAEQRIKHPAYPLHWAFRPGDQVRAKVLGVGEPSVGFLLSTGEEAAGVIYARAVASGEPLLPVAWDEMQCGRTGQRERRKCAKPE